MPEEQNVWGDDWHKQFNSFLTTILHWEQLGASNTDVIDPESKKPRGIDSVFSYRRNPHSPQQIVLVEAKSIAKLQNLNRYKIQDWLTTIFSNLERLPKSKDFKDKFQPEIDAQYQMALLGLWIRDEQTFLTSRLRDWLSQIHLPERKIAHHIGLISNDIITRLIAVHEEIERLRSESEQYSNVEYFIPEYSDLPYCDGKHLPIETIFSKFIFCKARMLQKLKGQSDGYNSYDSSIVFYLGSIQDYQDLRFIGLALRQFQLLKTEGIIVYTLYNPTEIRNEIANFHREFGLENSKDKIGFSRLVPRNQIPGWMERQ